MQYQALTTEIYHTLLSEFDDNKSKVIVDALNKIFEVIELKNKEEIIDKKETLKAELYNELRSELATKEFTEKKIYEVKSEISEVRAEISEFKSEVNAEFSKVREEMSEFKSEVNAEFSKVREEISEVKIEISNIEYNLGARIIKLEERFNKMEFMMKTLIGLVIFGLTLANPNFTSLMEKIFG